MRRRARRCAAAALWLVLLLLAGACTRVASTQHQAPQPQPKPAAADTGGELASPQQQLQQKLLGQQQKPLQQQQQQQQQQPQGNVTERLRLAGVYVSSNVVEAFLLCPMRRPARWDPAVFDPSLSGFIPALWEAGEKLPAGFFKTGGSCSYHLLDSIEYPCTLDDWGGHTGNATSLSTMDGCCLKDCASEMAYKNRRCLDELFQLICTDPTLKEYAAGLANAFMRCANISLKCGALVASSPVAAAAAPLMIAPAAPAHAAAAAAAAAKAVYVPANVVERWDDCPVAAPAQWEPSMFNATEQSIQSAVNRYREDLGDCADIALSAFMPCLSGNSPTSPSPGLNSFSSTDGCCLADWCADKLVSEKRCINELYQLACADPFPAAASFAAGLSNALIRCANIRLDCLAAPVAKGAHRAAAEGKAAVAFKASRVVRTWQECPVPQPTPWDLRIFDTNALASRYRGVLSLYAMPLDRRDPKPLFQRLSKNCREPLFLSLAVCANDNDKFSDPSGMVTSFSTTDGCCLRDCAARLREVIDRGCWSELMAYLCNDTLSLPVGRSWLDLPFDDPRRAMLRSLSYDEMRVASDIFYFSTQFKAGVFNGLLRCANLTAKCPPYVRPPTPPAVIAGATVGSVVGAALLATGAFFVAKRFRARRDQGHSIPAAIFGLETVPSSQIMLRMHMNKHGLLPESAIPSRYQARVPRRSPRERLLVVVEQPGSPMTPTDRGPGGGLRHAMTM